MSTSPTLQNPSFQQNNSPLFQNGDSMVDSARTGQIVSDQLVPFKMPRALPHVYSCFVVNQTTEPIECILKYSGRPGEEKFDDMINTTIPANSEHYFPRQFFQPEKPESFCKWVKIITCIQVKKLDGRIMEVNYPFEDVHHPVRNWEFHVRDNGDILSKPPTRVVNVLKYEHLDQYEC